MSNIDHQNQTKAYALLLIAPLFMATNPIIGKVAVEVVPPVTLSFLRWLTAFLILLPFAGKNLQLYASTLMRQWKILLILGTLGMGVCGAFVYIGLQSTTAINTGLIYAASPVLILMINAHMYGNRIRGNEIAGIILAIVGVGVVLLQGEQDRLIELSFTRGDWWIVCATIAWAVYSVLLKAPSFSKIPVIALFAAIAFAGTIVQFPFYVWEISTQTSFEWTSRVFISIAGVALVSSVLAFGCYQKAISIVGSARAGPFMYLMPIYGAVLAVSFLNESFQYFHAIGLALVLTGVFLSNYTR